MRGAVVLFIAFSFLAVTASSAEAATPPAALWTARYDGPTHANDSAYSVAASSDGKTVVTAGSTGGPSSDFLTVAYDAATGHRRWARRYDGPGATWDTATGVAITPDSSSVIVTGASGGDGTASDFATIAYDLATGAKQWGRRYNGPANGNDGAVGLRISSDGSTVVVSGQSVGVGTEADFTLIAYDATTGQNRWVRQYTGSANNVDSIFQRPAITPDGKTAFITGLSYDAGTLGPVGYITTIAYDVASGDVVWLKKYSKDPSKGAGVVGNVAEVSPDGGTVVVGGGSGMTSTSRYDAQVIAYDAVTGTKKWAKTFTGPGDNDDFVFGVAFSSSVVVVTGRRGSDTTGDDIITVAYDLATGERLWAQRYDGPAHGDDVAWANAVTQDGSTVVVTGQSAADDTGTDLVTVAYDASTGGRLWTQRYDGPAHGEESAAVSIAISPDDGAAYVVGTSASVSNSNDIATIAYPIN